MLGLNRKKKEVTNDPIILEQEGSRYLVTDTKSKARREGSVMRVVGNLLIVAGLVMLLGIGGWYGFTTWSNEQYKQQAVAAFGPDTLVDEVPADATPVPTVPPLPTPLPLPTATALPNLTTKDVEDKWNLTKVEKVADTSPPVRLHIPSVQIDQQVVPVGWEMIPASGGGMKSEWQVADFAVGHHQGSANPGQRGNVVLSGHVDYKGQVFKELHNVKKGDEVVLYTEKGQYIYVVHDLVIVREEGVSDEQKRRNAQYMAPTMDLTLTMITCWPYGIDTHRLVVIAKPYQSALSTQSEFSLR